jgi:Domain of unknown function (DUF4279)
MDPDVITRETWLQPSQTRRVGQRLGDRRTYSESMWAFNGANDDHGRHWESIEEGLTFVLDRLAGSEHLIAKYTKEYRTIWWCGHFQSSFDGGPVLSARLLERLGAFGVDLFIDNYFSPDEGTE